jgi:hypothetical protein
LGCGAGPRIVAHGLETITVKRSAH